MRIIHSIVELLTEAYEGPPDPSSTWFIDNEANSGILGLLAGVTAMEASRSVDGSGKNGTTIAANAEHLRWSLENMNAVIQGKSSGKWKESWSLLDTDQARWDRLRSAIKAEFEALCQALQGQTDLPQDYLMDTLALIPHAAYHLGTIRQMIERVRAA